MTANPFEEIDNRLEQIETTLQEIASKQSQPTQVPTEKYLDTNQLCELLGISRVTAWEWGKKGMLSPIRIGNLKRYRLSDIETLLARK
jgi:predicted DNA-binding transcriptional regulator AlpA